MSSHHRHNYTDTVSDVDEYVAHCEASPARLSMRMRMHTAAAAAAVAVAADDEFESTDSDDSHCDGRVPSLCGDHFGLRCACRPIPIDVGKPSGVAVDPNGPVLYVADTKRKCVVAFEWY